MMLLVLAGLLDVAACGTSPPPAQSGPVPTIGDDPIAYRVRVGDQVEVSVFTASGDELQAVQGERVVDRAGRIYLPLVGSITVVGLDAGGIRDLLVEAFSAFYESPVVDLTVQLRVNVTGRVSSPGHYFVDPSSTIIDALAIAGGSGSEIEFGGTGAGAADNSQVQLVRDEQRYILDLRPESVTAELINMRVQSGDWIFVPARTRSQLRDDISFLSSILGLIGSVAAIIVVAAR